MRFGNVQFLVGFPRFRRLQPTGEPEQEPESEHHRESVRLSEKGGGGDVERGGGERVRESWLVLGF